MFVIKRNQVIVTALVIMIAIAGYLNYVDNKAARDNDAEMVLSENVTGALVPNEDEYSLEVAMPDLEGEIGIALNSEEDLAVMNEMSGSTSSENQPDPGAAVFVSSQSDSAYFVQAKLEREQARARQKEILSEMLSNKNLDKEERSEFATAMLDIQKRIEKETSAEAMIEAKGFSEVYVRIDDETVDVVVNKEALSEAERAQIEDIIERKTGMESSQIRISTLKQ